MRRWPPAIRLQALLRASRTPPPPAQPGRAALGGKPSPTEQETAAALYEQLAFGDVAGDAPEDQDDGQEREFVVSPERLEWLRELQRRVGELARDVPKAETKRQRDGTAGTPPHRPG
ncbi:hypothetical protein GTZ89_42410 [Streptomyces sp. SID8382]|uniref:hypothetical protein n=1 Tax=Streptomyces malaysiensis TaxID=92644 RepID=UPI000C2BDA9A|nr:MULTISPECIES: hypothetical protein [unclassified Streptomyces]AUA08071.1 hypothetical protein CFP59_00156 [Streptomyces sp. M56]MYX62110.1 hypothetical protein [Streptomyces sp. SID8382]